MKSAASMAKKESEHSGELGENVKPFEREFTAKEVQTVLRSLLGDQEKIGLALLNYYARTDLVPASGRTTQRGRARYTYSDVILLSWLFRMKREGLPVNRFRRGIAYLRKRLPRIMEFPKDMVLLTDGKQLYLKHKKNDRDDIAEVLTGPRSGQYVWAYSIGSLIEEVDKVIDRQLRQAA
ncbi:MAG: hypothetical protein KDD44_03260 [Bdellovibrionales bacterium]|nr:hypothetical protein [Bdellovibrionales bacterium]